MGSDKAVLEFDGRTLLDRSLATLSQVCDEVVIAVGSSSARRGSTASVADAPGVGGPAAGILGAARAHPGRRLLVTACDLPNLTSALLEALCERDGDWVVPRHGDGLEPLCSLFAPARLSMPCNGAHRMATWRPSTDSA